LEQPLSRIAPRAWTVLVALLLSAWSQAALSAEEFLDPEVAFQGSVRPVGDKAVEVSFEIAPGYYLYREQFKFTATSATLGQIAVPAGKVKFDETFNKEVETHRGTLRINVPVEQAAGPFRLAVNYQGCADKGLCYPPAQMRADVSLTGFGGGGTVRVLPGRDMPIDSGSADSGAAPDTGVAVNTASFTDGLGIESILQSGVFWKIVAAFFVAGIALSVTPCVLPMVPILSSIIVGAGGGKPVSRRRSILLSISYSLGMGLVYTALGVAAGLAGEGLAAYLQTPWVLATFAAALVGLSLSIFGVYELRLPAALTNPLATASHRLPAGQFAGVFAMGGVSALIVSPCVAAPLAASLVFISQQRDVWLGGSALFAMTMGMSVPLLLVGASAGTLLPKTGAWMELVKRLFGLLLVAVAIWIIQPVIPASLALALWGSLLIGSAAMLRASGSSSTHKAWGRTAVTAVLAVIGIIQLVGAASGGTDPLKPLAHLRGGQGAASVLPFAPVKTVAQLDAALDAARQSNRPVMLDFYADWCVSCKEMERFTFADPQVQAKLSRAVLLKADVTQNNADDRELLKRFQLFGPPGTIFFDTQGREVQSQRVIGYQNTERFLETLRGVGL
jgi:thioredoxin:protein disulfide reductase